nr:hypothetical protein CFP56_59448 [Quercus suber]
MSGEGEVRSSGLETSLSSFENCRALEVTYPSTFYKAWDVRYVLRGKDEVGLRVGKVCPKLKRPYHTRLEKVREYLETVKNFDKLISPQSLSFHFLGLEPSNKEKKEAKTGLFGGLLSRKHQKEGEPPKDNVMVTSPVAKFQDHCPALLTSSMELIISPRRGFKTKAMSKVSIAYDVISLEDLEPLMGKPSSELMSSHVHKLMHMCGASLYIFGNYLDYDKKLNEAQSRIASLFAKNESLTIQISALTDEVKKGFEAVEKFKASDEFLDKLYDFYVDGRALS